MTVLVIVLFSLIVIQCESSATSDKNNQKNIAAGDCILSKWKLMNLVGDVNRDGKLSEADSKQISKEFTRLNHLTGEDKKSTEEKYKTYWTDCVLWNKQEISTNELGLLQRDAFLEDKNSFVEQLQKCEERFIDIVNMDNNDYISEKEHTTYLKAIGQTNEHTDKDLFEAEPLEAEGMPLKNGTSFWVNALMEDDCSKDENIFDTVKSKLYKD